MGVMGWCVVYGLNVKNNVACTQFSFGVVFVNNTYQLSFRAVECFDTLSIYGVNKFYLFNCCIYSSAEITRLFDESGFVSFPKSVTHDLIS